jgi:hypothetical protein
VHQLYLHPAAHTMQKTCRASCKQTSRPTAPPHNMHSGYPLTKRRTNCTLRTQGRGCKPAAHQNWSTPAASLCQARACTLVHLQLIHYLACKRAGTTHGASDHTCQSLQVSQPAGQFCTGTDANKTKLCSVHKTAPMQAKGPARTAICISTGWRPLHIAGSPQHTCSNTSRSESTSSPFSSSFTPCCPAQHQTPCCSTAERTQRSSAAQCFYTAYMRGVAPAATTWS